MVAFWPSLTQVIGTKVGLPTTPLQVNLASFGLGRASEFIFSALSESFPLIYRAPSKAIRSPTLLIQPLPAMTMELLPLFSSLHPLLLDLLLPRTGTRSGLILTDQWLARPVDIDDVNTHCAFFSARVSCSMPWNYVHWC